MRWGVVLDLYAWTHPFQLGDTYYGWPVYSTDDNDVRNVIIF